MDRKHKINHPLPRRTPIALAAAAGLAATLAVPDAFAATFRYAASSNRIYVENGGSVTLSDIRAALPDAPLALVDATNKVWLLSANLIIADGSTLVLHGSAAGGDVDELRLKSTNTSAADRFIYVSAEYGNIDIASTKVRSWNTASNAVDTEYATYGRAFMRVRSLLAPDGVTALESRMDIVDSDISYLGYNAAESYGLVWKVNGDPGPNNELYDKANVYGDIRNSHIHHNYYGVYTFGLEGGQWLNNELDHNVGYGFDPHDDSDDLVIDGNDVHDNGYHGIIASKRCDHVQITNNHSWNNAECGIMLHRSSNHGLIENNLSENNGDCGIALFATNDTVVRNNTLAGNAIAGLRLSMGSSSNTVDGNEMANGRQYGIYFYKGSDIPEPGSDGRNRDNVFTANNVHDNVADGVKMSDSDDNSFTDNTFSGNGDRITVSSSSNNLFTANTLQANTSFKISGISSIPTVVKFRSQPRVPVEVDSFGSAQFRDAGNRVFDTSFDLFTRITAGAGSLLDVDSTNFNGPSPVYRRDFTATPDAGDVDVNPKSWKIGASDQTKVWLAQVSIAGTRVRFVVGDMTPSASYDLYHGSRKLRTVTADATGHVSLSLHPPADRTGRYALRPAAP